MCWAPSFFQLCLKQEMVGCSLAKIIVKQLIGSENFCPVLWAQRTLDIRKTQNESEEGVGGRCP